MKRRDLERHLQEHGAAPLDEGGNHTRWVGPAGQRSTLPRHAQIGTGLTVAICKQLGVPKPPNAR